MVSYFLADKLPLRKTDVWDKYASIDYIPRAYGKATLSPKRYDLNGFKWVICDQPIVGVISVTRDGVHEAGWAFYNGVDSTGQAVAFLEVFTRASPGELEVTISGMKHWSTGSVVTNPADVVFDITTLTGSNITEGQLDIFRRECQEFNLALSGIIDTNRKTTDIFKEIAASCGAVYAGAIPSLFRVYPRTMAENEYLYNYFDADNVKQVTNLTTQHTDLYSILEINYDYNHATSEYGSNLKLRAKEVYKQIGEIPKVINLKWVKDNFLASQIGTRLLEHIARKIWKVDFIARKGIPSGGWVYFSHPYLPSEVWANTMILSTVYAMNEPNARYSIELPTGEVPEVEVVSLSSQYTPPAEAETG